MSLDSETKTALAEELEDVVMELVGISQLSPSEDDISTDSVFHSTEAEIERLSDITELYDYPELHTVTLWIHKNLLKLKADPDLFLQHNEAGLFYTWIELIATSLREDEPELLLEVQENLQSNDWLIKIDKKDLLSLIDSLKNGSDNKVSLETDESEQNNTPESAPEKTTTATESSYQLAWADDVHPELLEAFFIEIPDLVADFAEHIDRISQGGEDKETHQSAARVAHTIKGSSAVVGISAVASLAHKLEDILEHSVDNKLPPVVSELLLESADCLEAMFDSLATQSPAPAEYPQLLEQLTQWDKKFSDGYVDETVDEATTDAEKIIDKPSDATPEKTIADEDKITDKPSNATIEQTITDADKITDKPSDEKTDKNNTEETATDKLTDKPTDKQYPLAWNKDVHPELLDAYMSETPAHVIEIAQLLRVISKEKVDAKTYKKASRLSHTIKGTSAVIGITAVADFSQQLEEIFDYAEENTLPKSLSPLLNESADLLESLYDSLLSEGVPPAEYLPLYERLCDWKQHIDKSETKQQSPEEPAVKKKQSKADKQEKDQLDDEPSISSTPLKIDLPPLQDLLSTAMPVVPPVAPPPAAKIQRANLNESTLRIPVSIIEQLLNFSSDLITTNTQLADHVDSLLAERKNTSERNERIRTMLDELEWAVNQQSSKNNKPSNSQKKTDFDNLEMDSYNELHSITGLLSESIDDERETSISLLQKLNELKGQIHTQKSISRELNNTVLNMRMEPIKILTPRLKRIVRETCRSTGKQAKLEIIGDDLSIDTDVIKGLIDPLLHLLRNAVDHGIESPKNRKKQGKDKTGKILLTFTQQGDQVVLTLKDDGVGIDAEKIYQTAIKKGIINKASKLSKDEKLRLILEAGFSTQETVTDISGRGVGMDVVNTAVKNMSGNITISSTKNKGSEIQLQVPLTLSAANVLLVKVLNNTVAIPNSSIHQIHYLTQDELISKDKRLFVVFQKQNIPLLSLSSLLDWSDTAYSQDKNQSVIIVEHQTKYFALYVDEILKPQEITLKTLKPWMTNVKGVNGVCLLANGVVSPVLNMFDLLRTLDTNSVSSTQNNDAEIKDTKTNKILVVDDSLSNRKALSLMLQALDYDVSTAIDGFDALQKIEKTVFKLIITDLEMPKMDGLELVESLRSWSKTQQLPVIMVTSRSTEKHRVLADQAGVNAYLTKPVDNATLKSTVEHFFLENNLNMQQKLEG
ncbi:MAG: hypothetical protein DSZ29_07295 [Aquificaceae bacterium]|nr:MAG: hypothetical protein DSZ29_07295 [Aquificaceae bacterium]